MRTSRLSVIRIMDREVIADWLCFGGWREEKDWYRAIGGDSGGLSPELRFSHPRGPFGPTLLLLFGVFSVAVTGDVFILYTPPSLQWHAVHVQGHELFQRAGPVTIILLLAIDRASCLLQLALPTGHFLFRCLNG